MIWPFRKRPRGLIAYLNLSDWWESLSKSEQSSILKHYQPLGGGDNIVTGEVLRSDHTAPRFLSTLAQWLLKDEPILAFNILNQAQARLRNEAPDDLFFILHDLISGYYRLKKNIPEAAELCEIACRQQIVIADEAIAALKAHDKKLRIKHQRPLLSGYEKLVLLLESQGRFKEALSIQLEGEARNLTGVAEGRKARLLKKS